MGEVSMRSRGFLIARTAIILSIGMLYASEKNENWMDKPYTQWDQKEVAELFNKSAWAQAKIVPGPGGEYQPHRGRSPWPARHGGGRWNGRW